MAEEKDGGAGEGGVGGSGDGRRKNNVRALNAAGVTPAVVLGHVMEEAHELEDLFVIGFRKDGTPMMWSAGTLDTMGLAIVCMQDLALKYLNGMVDEGFN